MAEIRFFEKPGCINGEKQKNILRAAGHTLSCVNILEHQWTKEELLNFVAGKTPAEIMNFTAPAIKNGDITPADLSFDEALDLMLADPILIKRPLIEVAGQHIQGFLHPELQSYLGKWSGEEDVVTCPNLQTISCDEQNR